MRVGRAQNYLEPEHIKKIFEQYYGYKDIVNYAKVATMNDIESNDYSLHVPLYVNKRIKDNLPSAKETLAELKIAWNKSLISEKKFRNFLNVFIK